MECKHQWQGQADRVACLLCGESMSVEDYVAMITPKPAAKKPAAKKEKKADE